MRLREESSTVQVGPEPDVVVSSRIRLKKTHDMTKHHAFPTAAAPDHHHFFPGGDL